jgi:D-alanine transaminase/branched-chain amino acid aminotransferase
MNQVWSVINGEFIPAQEAKISVSDLGLQRGYGIFDYFKTVNGNPVFLEDHLDRFFNSANAMQLPIGFSRDELKQIIYTLIHKNNIPDSGIKITLTGGNSEDGYTISQPNLIITQSYLGYNPAVFDKGLKLMTYSFQRQLPEIKTIDYLQAILLQKTIRENNADDILYHSDGELRECPRTNIFLVMEDDTILTPGQKVLAGITRKQILGLNGFNFNAGPVPFEKLWEAKEIFISSTTKLIIPVVEVDGRKIADGKSGSITLELWNQLRVLEGV